MKSVKSYVLRCTRTGGYFNLGFPKCMSGPRLDHATKFSNITAALDSLQHGAKAMKRRIAEFELVRVVEVEEVVK